MSNSLNRKKYIKLFFKKRNCTFGMTKPCSPMTVVAKGPLDSCWRRGRILFFLHLEKSWKQLTKTFQTKSDLFFKRMAIFWTMRKRARRSTIPPDKACNSKIFEIFEIFEKACNPDSFITVGFELKD